MRRYLLDSNAVNAFIDHRESVTERVREARLRGDRIGTCEPVVAELFYGLEFSSSREENIIRLNRALSQIRSWPFDRSAAREFARVAADLKCRGMKIQVVDMGNRSDQRKALAARGGNGVQYQRKPVASAGFRIRCA